MKNENHELWFKYKNQLQFVVKQLTYLYCHTLCNDYNVCNKRSKQIWDYERLILQIPINWDTPFNKQFIEPENLYKNAITYPVANIDYNHFLNIKL
jgi:hypothetical protein